MGADQTKDWQEQIASALDWWREAGVDGELQDTPRDWLSQAAPAPGANLPVVPAPQQLPATLAAFATWRIGPDALEAPWGAPIIPPTGPVTAALMVLVEQPERDDGNEGRLLGGASGRLFDRMLAAIGLDRTQVHVASIAVARPVAGRMPREAVEPLATIARHYVGLVRPKVLLLLGNAPCHVVLGELCHGSRGVSRLVNHAGDKQAGDDAAPTMALASFHPQQLLERPQLKAESWKDLQMLAGELAR